jgi:hypothetical protein
MRILASGGQKLSPHCAGTSSTSAAAVLARIARADVLAAGPGKPERSGEVWAL